MEQHLLEAIFMITSFDTFTSLFIGVVVGVVVGALPGLGSVIGITLCLPFTFTMSNIAAISLLVGVYGGSVYGGSISGAHQHPGHARLGRHLLRRLCHGQGRASRKSPRLGHHGLRSSGVSSPAWCWSSRRRSWPPWP
jgi:hypothetical protein